MMHTQPCGCVVTTEEAHVVDIQWCPVCKVHVAETMRVLCAIADREIEDSIFDESERITWDE